MNLDLFGKSTRPPPDFNVRVVIGEWREDSVGEWMVKLKAGAGRPRDSLRTSKPRAWSVLSHRCGPGLRTRAAIDGRVSTGTTKSNVAFREFDES